MKNVLNYKSPRVASTKVAMLAVVFTVAAYFASGLSFEKTNLLNGTEAYNYLKEVSELNGMKCSQVDKSDERIMVGMMYNERLSGRETKLLYEVLNNLVNEMQEN